jgi:CheY-like chemotaxis protein
MNTTLVNLACIIDDDNIYVSLIKKIIKAKNLCSELLIFNNGQQSMTYFEDLCNTLTNNEIPEIIFLDLNMPIMDGWEFLEKFSKIKDELKKEITLYVVSSSINPSDMNRAKSSPTVKDYLVKPVHVKDLETIFMRKAV